MYIGRRNVEGGGRQQSFANDSFRMVAGVRGAINEAWGYDASAQFSQVRRQHRDAELLRVNRLQRALDVIDVGGVPTCRSVIDGTDPPAFPGTRSSRTGQRAQLNYLQADGLQIGRISQEIYNGVINGDLGAYGIQSPLASDGIQVVFGTEYRRDALDNYVDALQVQPALRRRRWPDSDRRLDQGATTSSWKPASRSRRTRRSPRASPSIRPTGIRITAAAPTDTYKFGLEWAPVADVRLRGSYQRAVRAANIVELFTGMASTSSTRRAIPAARRRAIRQASDAECIATGVPARPGGLGLARQPGGAVQVPAGRQPGPHARKVGYVLLRHRVPAALGAGPRRHGRLLRHLDRRHDLDVRRHNTWTACYANNDPAACARIYRNPTASCGSATASCRTSTSTSVRSRRRLRHQHRVHGRRDRPLRQPLVQPDGHLPDRPDHQPAPGIDLHPSPDIRGTGLTASASTRRSAACRLRSGGTVSARAGRRPGTSTCRSPGATTAA